MKKILMSILAVLSAITLSTSFAANPASTEWVLQQVAANSPLLTAANWNAVCTTGSPASATGCYGNAASSAFATVSSRLGGFLRYANINPVNTPSSVFVKAFFAGTNTPAQDYYLNITVSNSAARCALFTQVGHGLGLGGVSTSNPANGSSTGAYINLHGVTFTAINNTTSNALYYNDEAIGGTGTPLSNVVVPNPIYLLCVGYNTTDYSTAAAITVTAT